VSNNLAPSIDAALRLSRVRRAAMIIAHQEIRERERRQMVAAIAGMLGG
jgi:hypothetical protein